MKYTLLPQIEPVGTTHITKMILTEGPVEVHYSVLLLTGTAKHTPQAERPIVYLKKVGRNHMMAQTYISIPLDEFVVQFKPKDKAAAFWAVLKEAE